MKTFSGKYKKLFFQTFIRNSLFRKYIFSGNYQNYFCAWKKKKTIFFFFFSEKYKKNFYLEKWLFFRVTKTFSLHKQLVLSGGCERIQQK